MGLGDKSLFDRFEECRKEGLPGIPQEELLGYLEDSAEAIDFLNRPVHDLGTGQAAIQHCDIKPHNLMIVGGSVQVCDFGLARMMGSDRATTAAGSIAYAAPETLIENNPSFSTDQYSLAITYYELKTGKLPYPDDSLAAILDAKRDAKLDFSDLPNAEQAVLRRATLRNPDERYASCREMIAALAGRATSGAEQPLAPRSTEVPAPLGSRFPGPGRCGRGSMVHLVAALAFQPVPWPWRPPEGRFPARETDHRSAQSRATSGRTGTFGRPRGQRKQDLEPVAKKDTDHPDDGKAFLEHGTQALSQPGFRRRRAGPGTRRQNSAQGGQGLQPSRGRLVGAEALGQSGGELFNGYPNRTPPTWTIRPAGRPTGRWTSSITPSPIFTSRSSWIRRTPRPTPNCAISTWIRTIRKARFKKSTRPSRSVVTIRRPIFANSAPATSAPSPISSLARPTTRPPIWSGFSTWPSRIKIERAAMSCSMPWASSSAEAKRLCRRRAVDQEGHRFCAGRGDPKQLSGTIEDMPCRPSRSRRRVDRRSLR